MGRTTPEKDAIGRQECQFSNRQRHGIRKRIAPPCSTSRLMTKTMLRIASASSDTLLLFIPTTYSAYVYPDA